MASIVEPARETPVMAEADVCVVGGSCTGVFAAVRAARLGASVVVIERGNAFGGVATQGLVSVWHSLLDTEHRRPIIAGLTREVVDRLGRRGAVQAEEKNADMGFRMNGEELKIELDELVIEHRITPYLHTLGCAPIVEDGEVRAVLIENKDGRGAIRAKVVVDASGDGDIAVRAGIPFEIRGGLQPPTTCAKVLNFHATGFNLRETWRAHRTEFGLAEDSGWDCPAPQLPGITMVAQTHVFGVNAASAAGLTRAEIEGRRQARALLDMIRRYGPQGNSVALVQLPAAIGIRETRSFAAAHRLTEEEVLRGVRFPDAIAQGSYRVDVHAPAAGGFLFKYLDGRTLFAHGDGCTEGRWREPTAENPTFYQIPYRCLHHPRVRNLLLAGRMISADRGAFGAIRVMVNLNQTGEAAGVAAALAARGDGAVARVDPAALRKTLTDGGSIML